MEWNGTNIGPNASRVLLALGLVALFFVLSMGQPGAQDRFENLLYKTHVEHALLQPEETHNEIPIALATLLFLQASPAQLQAVYDWERRGLRTWSLSPSRIANENDVTRFLGDERFQRAYMDYFSMENIRRAGNAKTLALSYLITGTNPLIYGLFGAFGKPLTFFSDAMELGSAVLVVEALVLTAVDWSQPICDLLRHPQLSGPVPEFLPPETILDRIAYDGRLGGLKSGPGYDHVSQVWNTERARNAILEYIHRLDVRNLPRLLNQLARLSVLLLCATHKSAQPAFDYYLGALPTFVCCLRTLLENLQDSPFKIVLVRGVWLLMLLSYVTQLRPIVDPTLITSTVVPEHELHWDSVFAEFHGQPDTVTGQFQDAQFLRSLRSLQQLSELVGADTKFYIQAAWKLRRQWQGWIGLGADREESLNIRL